ncbi:GDP-L-fucose synthase [Aliidongia dinghuensis]|uniref:GDP-L-fucose synthase n=1 Tax=Aliidongia dinghuensis TaxID=1867774 RepID=A0A8J2YXF8_9PROT|nr:GDP-L-fucose synthase [Aliidongia dinghuensis]GGF36272.1 GDP-L-fucose synthase [Aliidongia dinghuensis]
MDGLDFSLAGKRIAVAGHRGMVGRALVRRLGRVDCEILGLGRAEADLANQADTFAWLERHRPDVVVVAAAKVGGILANSRHPATFLYDNLAIETNLVEGARRAGVAKLLLLGSTCIYPKLAPQPIPEDSLLTGPLEPTNEWYAIAKIAGVKLCQAYRRQYGLNFISAMPTNLYGPFDNFDLETSHVLAALIAKAHRARETGAGTLALWGTGTPRREFLHVDDLADACVFLLEHYGDEAPINIGFGSDVTINELAELVARTVGWQGRFVHELDKPDGTPRKLVDSTKLTALGWRPSIPLEDGVRATCDWYRAHLAAHLAG